MEDLLNSAISHLVKYRQKKPIKDVSYILCKFVNPLT